MSLKSYKKNPSKFKGKPKKPYYLDKVKGRMVVIFTNQQIKLKDNYIHFPKLTKLEPIKTNVTNIVQVRIVPKINYSVVEIVYNKEVTKHKLNSKLYLSIDLGLNNLTTLCSNIPNTYPIIVNGKIIKSYNYLFNKTRAKLQSYLKEGTYTSKRINNLIFRRNMKINNYLHHTSKFIINYCIKFKIKNIVIGYNEGWKDKINIGKVNNQNFVGIPFKTLIEQITYKAEENNINVTLKEESYTSKCDSLALEKITKHSKYLGKRKKRGLFQSSIGTLINADVNGSLNILRKSIGDDFLSLAEKSCVSQPLRINSLEFYL